MCNSVSTSFIALESENDSEVALSESKEEFLSSSQPFRRETRATRRAMQNRGARRKNGEATVLPNVLFTRNCKSQFILAIPSIFNGFTVTESRSEIACSTGDDEYSGKSSSLKRLQSSRTKSRNTRLTRNSEKRKPGKYQ